MTRETALKLLEIHIQNINLRRHCLAVGAVMKALASKLGGDHESWEVLGLIHDVDWEKTKADPSLHTRVALDWLENIGEKDPDLLHALQSHNRKHTNMAELNGKMEWSLECCDELTGFIVAVALIYPDKKLSSVTVDSILKKFSSPSFAASVDRDQISQCESRMGIPLPEFINIALTAMQAIGSDLGL